MTPFDELLQRAFASGYNRGYDTAKADDGHHVTKMAPAFNDWRATLSGLDVREDLGPIEVGDTVKILPSWGAEFARWHYSHGTVYYVQPGSVLVDIVDGSGTTSLAVSLAHVEKVRP